MNIYIENTLFRLTIFTIALWTMACFTMYAQVDQVNVPRIEMMPNEPSPYNVRDWRDVAYKYDALIFDQGQTGDYLPFIYFNDTGVNYPERGNFGLHTYVGTFSPQGNEAINVLPALIGASLVDIDKSNQDGRNYILMSQDFFNKNNGEFIYLNNLSGASGNDWWYELMPNVFFYQLYDLYRNIGGDSEHQFTTVADRFVESVKALGGSDTPWSEAFMNYRSFDFKEMEPIPDGVKQPEAAGAYAWVLYHAYKETENRDYLKAAEWSLEFLSDWSDNPSYELQLPYGTYTAAKMNAEIGTTYDVEKMVNWSFDRGFLRGWGTIVGKWGGLDVSGLVGEANDNGNDYAFQLNGVQQAAALVPMVRYDKRFARAIGKWVLNLANATRLFYPGFLPASLQDASDWSASYDHDRVVGYEALREKWEGLSPFSTGDALRGNWAATNLALYGTSSIGYLGAILNTTSDNKIFQIDLLKTDFFGDDAYPSYLFFNPYPVDTDIVIDVGAEQVDIYDALSETFILESVTGQVAVTIPSNDALSLVYVPSGAQLDYDRNTLKADGIIIDYMQTAQSFTQPPRIKALAAELYEVEFGDSTNIHLTVVDQDSDNLTISWTATGGNLQGSSFKKSWIAPEEADEYDIRVIVEDGNGNKDSLSIQIDALSEINQPPVIESLLPEQLFIAPGQSMLIECIASDPNGDPLTYTWTTTGGVIQGEGSQVTWVATDEVGSYNITCRVDDGRGLSSEGTLQVLVKNLSGTSNSNIIAHYPFLGDALDISGNNLHAEVRGAFLTNDQNDNANAAYRFNGVNHHMTIDADPVLNVTSGISVVCIFKPIRLPEKEVFLASHGSWQNRWKLSITPENVLRWTINSSSGPIRDLDAKFPLNENEYYHVTATHDGAHMILYINGEMQSFTELSGGIRTSQLPMLFAQMLPGEQEFNFNGVIDEIRIYDGALFPKDADSLFNASITVSKKVGKALDQRVNLFPNPTESILYIEFEEIIKGRGQVLIHNMKGQLMKTIGLENEVDLIAIDVSDFTSGIYHITLSQRDAGRSIGIFTKT